MFAALKCLILNIPFTSFILGTYIVPLKENYSEFAPSPR